MVDSTRCLVHRHWSLSGGGSPIVLQVIGGGFAEDHLGAAGSPIEKHGTPGH